MRIRQFRLRLPTRRRDWMITGRAVRLVLSIPAYAGFAVVSAVCGLSLFVFSQNPDLIRFIILHGGRSLAQRATVLVHLYPIVGSTYSILPSTLLLASAALLGVNFSMLAYHLREHDTESRGSSVGGLSGALFGTLGAGCAACGSTVFAGILSAFGATGLLAILPFDGLSFTVIAFVTIVLSIYWVADGMRGARINGCPVDV